MGKKKFFWSILPMYLFLFALFLGITNLGSDAVTAYVQFKQERPRICIIIDPGHGGEDGGAVSYTGVYESKLNLEISLKLRDLLNLMGLHTKMIRTSDESVYLKGETLSEKKISDLKNRVSTVKNTKSAVLLSIHQNNFSDSRYSGAQIFYGNNQESALLARKIQKMINKNLNGHRKAKKAKGIYLMDKVTCPAVLIECGFLSNPAEERRLRDPQYQLILSAVIASSITGFVAGT